MKATKQQKLLVGIFIVLALAAIFERLLDGFLVGAFKACLTAGVPLLTGLVITFLLAPVVTWLENKVFYRVFSRLKNRSRAVFMTRILSIISVFIVLLTILALLLALVIPGIYNNAKELIERLPQYVSGLKDTIVAKLKEFSPYWYEKLISSIPGAVNDAGSLIKNNLGGILGFIASFTISVGRFVINFVLSLLVTFFMLKDREKFTKWASGLLSAIVNDDNRYRDTRSFLHEVNLTFSRYVSGMLLKTLVIGIISAIMYMVIGVKYYVLFALILAITNLIPYLGPFIGGAPAVLIALYDSPEKALLVIIAIFALNQLEALIISPLILGDKLKVSPLWIIAGVLFGGAIFGIAGMVLGAPVMAIIVGLIDKFIKFRHEQLNKRNMTQEYENDDII